jgi:hypothetical protein
LFTTYQFGLFFGLTSPAAPVSLHQEPLKLSFITTLLENTQMYSLPNYMLKPRGVIVPQEVHVVGAEEKWDSFEAVTDKKWFKVETWQGEQMKKTGIIQKNDLNLWLGKDARLYNSRFYG